MNKKSIIVILVLYFLSAAVSFGAFAVLVDPASTVPLLGNNQQTAETEEEVTALGALLDIDPSEPKDQVCPLNGQLYTMTEKKSWETRRPLAVMIENHPDARPQSGLSDADIVFASARLRAQQTAARAAPHMQALFDPVFNEAPLPPPLLPGVRYLPKTWNILARAAWLNGHALDGESVKQARQRAAFQAYQPPFLPSVS